MSFNTRLLESIDIVAGLVPQDFNTSATSDYICLKNYEGVLVYFTKAAGTAGDDPSLQLYQASDVSGTGEKALTFDNLYSKIGTQTGVNIWTKQTITATADLDLQTPTDFVADNVEASFVIDVRAATLDVSNGFDCLCFKNDGADIGNTSLAAVIFILYGARYPSPIPLTAITN